jgi:hypothetical protein
MSVQGVEATGPSDQACDDSFDDLGPDADATRIHQRRSSTAPGIPQDMSPELTWSASGGVRDASFRKKLPEEVAKLDVEDNAPTGFVRTKKPTSVLSSLASGS